MALFVAIGKTSSLVQSRRDLHEQGGCHAGIRTFIASMRKAGLVSPLPIAQGRDSPAKTNSSESITARVDPKLARAAARLCAAIAAVPVKRSNKFKENRLRAAAKNAMAS